MSRSLYRRSQLASLPLLAAVLGAGWPLSGQNLDAGIEHVGRVVVNAGLSGAQLSYLAVPTDTRVADSFHAVASRLHATRERWGDAALLHVFAADLRGPADPKSLTDLMLAADLFSGAGDHAVACAVLERATAVAVRVGRLNDARYCHERAKLTGSAGCSETWGSLLTDFIVPAPGSISVDPPDLKAGAKFGSHLPPPPGPIIVDSPDLAKSTWPGADAVPIVPAVAAPRLPWPEVQPSKA